MKFELKSGKKIEVKEVSIDERDEMLDSIKYNFKEDGTISEIKMMHSTMTKWIRTAVKGDTSDKFLKTLSMEDRTEIFSKIQGFLLQGEEKASK